MNRKLLLIWILLVARDGNSQFGPVINYKKDIIKKYGIQSISEWYFPQNKSLTESDSILKVYHIYDKKGNRLMYRQRDYADNLQNEYHYEYDSSSRLIHYYEVHKDSSIGVFYQYIYQKDRLTEERSYTVPWQTIRFHEKSKVLDQGYSRTRYDFDSTGRRSYESYCLVNYPAEKDSLVEVYDSTVNAFRLFFVPKRFISDNPVKCLRTIEVLYDEKGNKIRIKSLPNSNIYVYDTFAYDKQGNMTLRINYNSGVISNGNPREYRKNHHQYEHIENRYNQLVQLTETVRRFNMDSLAYLLTRYEYFRSGQLKTKTILKFYRDGTTCSVRTFSDEINFILINTNNRVAAVKNNWIQDTLEYHRYNEQGDLTDKRLYHGIMQVNREGTLEYQEYRKFNPAGFPEYEFTFYAKRLDFPRYKTLEPSKYEYHYTHYPSGLIKEKIMNGRVIYKIRYEFY